MSNPIFHSQYTAQQIEDEITNGVPRISETTTNWERWDIATQQWVDTGVPADAQEAAERAEAAAESAEEDAESVAAVADAFDDYVAAIYGAYPHDSITDTAVASFPDGADNIPVKSLTVNITPVQSGSGDPSPTNVRPISGWTGATISKNAGTVIISQPEDFIGQIDETATFTVAARGENLSYRWWYQAPGESWKRLYVDSATTPTLEYPITSEHLTWKYVCNVTGIEGTTLSSADVKMATNPADKRPKAPPAGKDAQTIAVSWQTEAGTVYGGTLTDNGDGTWKLTVTHKHLDVSTAEWTYDTSRTYPVWRCSPADQYVDGGSPMCSKYKSGAPTSYAGFANNSHPNEIVTVGVPTAILIQDPVITTPEAFDAAKADLQIVYPLKPNSILQYTLTAETVKTLLGDNNVFADCGDVAALTYRADTTLYIDKRLAALGS